MAACSGFFAPKLLVIQPRAYIFFPSRIYPAKSFIELDLGLLPVNNGGGILLSQRQVTQSVKEAAPSHGVVRFSAFEVDLRNGEVRKRGFRIKLQDQPFHVLQILLEHPGELVTREELQRQIWPADTFVDFEKGLNNAIKRLREALGDSAETPRFIETLPRRGYRFTAPVTSTNGSAGGQEITSGNHRGEPRRWFRWGAAMASAVGLAAATLFTLNAFRVRDRILGSAAGTRIQSLAVLPLTNLSGDPAQEYFSDGMTDALITDLAQIGSLKVISRTSVMHYKKTDKTLPQIARELNVDGIVEGTVQRSGDRVRISAQLIHAASDKHLWAASYERDLRDVFALERDVAGDISHQVRARITTENQAGAAQPRPVNLEALEAYLQGNSHLTNSDMGPRDEELRKAAKYFQHAIDADPGFAPPYLGLAEAHHVLWWPSSEDFAMMRASAEKALELAPTSPDAHVAVGVTKREDWDWAGAEEEFRRAIALSPNSASARVHLGDSLDTMGEMDEGWKEYEIAQELDPNQDHLSEALSRRDQYDRAIELLRRTVETRPEDAVIHWFLSENYARKGQYKEWVQELDKTMTVFGFPEIAGRVHRTFDMSGYAGALRQWAGELEHLAASKQGYFPGILAEVYAALGDKDRAFYWLGQGCEHRHMAISDPLLVFLKVNPAFASLRSDARYKDLLRRMGLPP